MKLSTHLRYGLRAMILLAKKYIEETAKPAPISIKEIATDQDVSEAFLRQIFYSLRKSGLINAERGKNGGYLLASAPEDISILDIANGLGESLAPVACADDPSSCHDKKFAKHCLTRPLWVSVKTEMSKLFGSTTLATLSGSNCDNMLTKNNNPKKSNTNKHAN